MGGHSPPKTVVLPCDENIYRNIGASLNLISQFKSCINITRIGFDLEDLNTIFRNPVFILRVHCFFFKVKAVLNRHRNVL